MIGLSHTKISIILWGIIEPSNWLKIHLYVANYTTTRYYYSCLWSHIIVTVPCCLSHLRQTLFLYSNCTLPSPYPCRRHTLAKPTTPIFSPSLQQSYLITRPLSKSLGLEERFKFKERSIYLAKVTISIGLIYGDLPVECEMMDNCLRIRHSTKMEKWDDRWFWSKVIYRRRMRMMIWRRRNFFSKKRPFMVQEKWMNRKWIQYAITLSVHYHFDTLPSWFL